MQYDQTWDTLAEVIGQIDYRRDPIPLDKEGRPRLPRLELQRDDEHNYAVLFIRTYNSNSYHPDQMRLTTHEAVVPVATYNELAWVRWVLERIRAIERHETDESFFYQGERIAAPHHGQGEDPYVDWFTRNDRAEQVTKAPGQA